ncbi:MAG: phytoene/squalene synthase family protein [Fimbriimonadaceae bacterium]|nr:phytoene/squalene synthase family protein [Fimbriimonadaceae bacterium]
MPFATEQDKRVCRDLHRQYGTTYYFASRRFEPRIRERVDALYAFVRVPDEWVDNPSEPLECVAAKLKNYREEMERGMEGDTPEEPALRAFCDLLREGSVPVAEARLFLDAMVQDLTVSRYQTYSELEGYMRGSAAAVGMMMAAILEAPQTPDVLAGACALGNAMQLTNFLRDIGEDYQRGRVYLPLDDLERFRVSESEIATGVMGEGFRSLMQFEIARARELYAQADQAIQEIPASRRLAVRLARVLYARILDRIEEMDYNVFAARARTSRMEKVSTAARLVAAHYLG